MKLDDFQIPPIRVCDGDIEWILFNAIVPGVRGKTPTETAWGKALGYGATLVTAATVFGSICLGPVSPPLADNLCPIGAVPATHVVMLVDKTDEYSSDQQEALASSLRERDLHLGERLSLYQMTPAGNAVVQLLYDRCRSNTGADADPINENPKFVERKYQEQFVQPFEQALAALTEPAPSDHSPIIEALYAIAHDAPLAEKPGRRMIEIWSDMHAKSVHIDQYGPNYGFEHLQQTNSLYLDLSSLRGSEIRIFQLANRYPAYQNGEHAQFWAEYFAHAGIVGSTPTIQRL